MTYNKAYKDCKPCESDSKLAKCKPKHPKPKSILLECGDGTGSRTFTSSNETPFQIAHITVDTTCLKKPEVLIKFSSLVKVERVDIFSNLTVRLQYELSRVCDDGSAIPLGTWLFEKVDSVNSEFINSAEESFNFIFCECNNCPRCCEYFVTITPIEITNARVIVSNGRMAALAGYPCDFPKNEDKNHDVKQNHPKLRKIMLECGQETGSVTFNAQSEPPVRIANVTIDTSRLCKTKVLVEFSSIVSYSVITPPGDPVILQFELFRVCDNGEPLSRGIWRFDVDFVNQTNISSKSFGFIFCERDNCLGCCEYFVTVTPIDVPIGFGENAMVSDSRIVALVESGICHEKEHNRIDYDSEKPKAKEVVLKCGQGNGSRTFATPSDMDFQLAQVTVGTKGLCKPEVNIEFSSIVSFDEEEGFIVARLRYELFRICDDGQPESRGVWVWRREKVLIGEITESFNFTFCEAIKCKQECCTYFVKVTPIAIDGGGQVTVSNGRIAALVQEQ